MGVRPRLLRLVLLALLASLLPLAVVAPATGGPAVVARDQPPPGADFPRLPSRCYDRADEIVSPCRITRYPGRPMVVVWGDSHAQMYLPALRQLARRQRVNLVAVLYGGCPLSTPYPRRAGYQRTGCDQHTVRSLAYVRTLTQRRQRVRILVNGFWSGYRQAYGRVKREERTGVPSGLSPYREQMARLAVERSAPMLRAIGRLGRPVDMVGQAAAVPLYPRRCARGREPYLCDLPRHRALAGEVSNRRWIRNNLLSRLPGRPRLVDTTPTYCNRKTCFAHVRGVNTYYDDIHLGAELTGTMTGYFRPIFRALAR